MQYFPLSLRRDVDKAITVKTEGVPSIEITVVYPTAKSGEHIYKTMVRGKSLKSAKQTAKSLGLY